LRKHAFPELPTFNDQDSSADFTFEDTTGVLAALLNIRIDLPKTILLEVKTSKDTENGFAFSPRQFKMVKNVQTEKR
jgi:hypothetical protein